MTHTPPGPGGRREANRARTRAALIAAVYDLIEAEGVDLITAERVADAAGLSRRTFFNYFESVEAAVAIGADDVLERVQRALAARPVGEAPSVSVVLVIEELFTVDFLTQATRAWRAVEGYPAARRHALATQSDQVIELAQDWGRARIDPDGHDPLRAQILTASVLAAFEQAQRHWLAGHSGDVDEAARTEFISVWKRAVATLRPALDL